MKKNITLKGKVPILSPGHGGVVNGIYTTSGKRSPKEMGKYYTKVHSTDG